MATVTRVAVAVLIAVFIVPASAPVSAQTGVPRAPRTGLLVTVTDDDGRPVGGVTVALSGGGRSLTQSTGADGVARFADLAAGDYDVTIDDPAFARVSRPTRVAAGAIATLDLSLRRTGPAAAPSGRVPTTAPLAAEPDSPVRSGVPAARQAAETDRGGLAPDDKVFVPVPDRWNIGLPDWDRYGERGDYPYVAGHWWDPYNRNRLKGDEPIAGQRTFFTLTGVSDTLLEGRNVPAATTPSTSRPFTESFFGRGGQYLPVSVVRASLDLFRGDTSFRPIDWRVRVQPAFSLNYLHARETGIVNRDVRAGTARVDTHVGLQEAFVEKKLADLGVDYDFVSVRAGIQELSTDFRGFVAVVEQPGVRVFGTLASSRVEFNAATFDFLEKDTNSGLNAFERRDQQMAVANVYVQDFLRPGYTTEFSYHATRDRGGTHYDTNGFLVRPAPIGLIAPHEIRAHYLGWAGSGHLGRLNVSHAFYQALGTDTLNPIAARRVRINAQMAAAELSVDRDWLRFKGSAFFASGDGDAGDDRARGFDSIVDVPVFAGGAISIWNRQGFGLSQTGTGLVSPFSLLPSLRTNKDEGQANFVNPGVLILSGGVDAELTPKLRTFTNVGVIRFQHTAPLEALLFQAPIDPSAGVDVGGGAQYRPPLSENIVVTGGAALMRLGQGLRDIYDRRYFVSVFANLRLQF